MIAILHYQIYLLSYIHALYTGGIAKSVTESNTALAVVEELKIGTENFDNHQESACSTILSVPTLNSRSIQDFKPDLSPDKDLYEYFVTRVDDEFKKPANKRDFRRFFLSNFGDYSSLKVGPISFKSYEHISRLSNIFQFDCGLESDLRDKNLRRQYFDRFAQSLENLVAVNNCTSTGSKRSFFSDGDHNESSSRSSKRVER